MGITREMLVCRRQDSTSANIGDEIVLMSSKFDKYYGLDDIGADIWSRIESPIRVRNLCAALAAGYDADVATIERDVLQLLDQLLQNELIERQPAD